MTRGLVVVATAMLLAACQPSPPDAPPAPAAPAIDGTPAPATSADAPAPDTPAPNGYDERLVNFGGYASARFNDDAAAVDRAWGKPMVATAPPESPEACYYRLTQARDAQGRLGLAFMIEGGKFVRFDVDSPTVVAPGGVRVGDPADAVRAAFPGQLTEQPHKYVEGGKVLVVAPADGGEARLVFEVDAQGLVTAWRIGLEPQVQYVEGCS